MWNSGRRLILSGIAGGGGHKSKFMHIKVEMSLGIGERMSNRQMDRWAEVSSLDIQICALLMGITEVVSPDDIWEEENIKD